MFRLFGFKCADIENLRSELQDALEALNKYERANDLNKMTITTLQEALEINQKTINLLMLTIESSKTTLRGILGIHSSADYNLETLTDMTATYIITLESQVSGH